MRNEEIISRVMERLVDRYPDAEAIELVRMLRMASDRRTIPDELYEQLEAIATAPEQDDETEVRARIKSAIREIQGMLGMRPGAAPIFDEIESARCAERRELEIQRLDKMLGDTPQDESKEE